VLTDSYVAQHLLNRLFGFELLMAPYAVAHLKLGMELQETGYSFGSDQRLGIYLTNTLEEAAKRSEKLFAQWISDEANAAAEIKRDLPIMVVMGNPPYSGHSANRSWEMDNRGKKVPNFIGRLLQDYYKVDGQPLGERNPKWLQDDYVKFLRFGQWRIERTGAGILAFITNHGYLDNPTFRGMRQQLMNAFTEIYVLDLHGNAKKKERAPDGSKDENVFDIQQGVCIGIFVREPGKARPAKVFHADLWGLREGKYKCLFETDIESTRWTQLSPRPPVYMLVPQNAGLLAEYEKGWRLPDVLTLSSVGIVTARDNLTIHWSSAEIWKTVQEFVDLSAEEARGKYELGKDTRDWKVQLAQEDIRLSGPNRSNVVSLLYRPFDIRFTYYTGQSRGFICMPRPEVMHHILAGRNLALVSARSNKSPDPDHFFCSRLVVETKCGESTTQSCTFPLYLYPFVEERKLGQKGLDVDSSLWPAGKDGRRPNLNPEFVKDLEKRLGMKFVPEGKGDVAQRSPSSVAALPPRRALGGAENARAAGKAAGLESEPCATGTFGPEDVFNYIYAVFHSPTYRSRYAEFLKSDFPRVPLTSDVNLFRALSGKGAELVALHLVESPRLENPITAYPVKGSNVVEKGFPKYLAPGEPEPVFVEAASRRQKSGEVNSPLQAALPRLKEGRVYINAVAPDGACPDVIGDRRADYGVRELAPALESGGKPPQSKPALAERRYSGQYFEGVPPEVWNFHIGGYQVCEKWLKDRRGRTLSFDDLTHYQKIITALKETIRLMAEIDAAIPKWPIE
jgi:hypothetical protein